jgi:hypothetical protein
MSRSPTRCPCGHLLAFERGRLLPHTARGFFCATAPVFGLCHGFCALLSALRGRCLSGMSCRYAMRHSMAPSELCSAFCALTAVLWMHVQAAASVTAVLWMHARASARVTLRGSWLRRRRSACPSCECFWRRRVAAYYDWALVRRAPVARVSWAITLAGAHSQHIPGRERKCDPRGCQQCGQVVCAAVAIPPRRRVVGTSRRPARPSELAMHLRGRLPL